LGQGFRLTGSHEAGWLRLVAVFTPTPLDVEEIQGAVERLRRAGPSAIREDLLFPDRGDVVEQTVVLELSGER
jgi:hypothetical protein